MKNQNPQEILNEILLRMNYDLSKTLTENKVLVEQSNLNPPYKRKETSRQRQDIFDNYNNQFGETYRKFLELDRQADKLTRINEFDRYWKYWNELKKNVVVDSYLQEDEDVIRKIINRLFTINGNNVINKKTVVSKNGLNGYYYNGNGNLIFNINKPFGGVPADFYIKSKGLKTVGNNYELPSKITTSEYYNILNQYNVSSGLQKLTTTNDIKIKDVTNDIDSTKQFQDWLDFYKPGWLKGGSLNKNTDLGYGNFGPNTKAAYEKYKYDFSMYGLLYGYNEILRKYGINDEKSAAFEPWPSEEFEKFKSEMSDFKNQFKDYFGEEVFKIYFPEDAKKEQQKQIEDYALFVESEYQNELTELKKKFGIRNDMVSPYNTGLAGKELQDYNVKYQKTIGNCAYNPEYCKALKDLEFKYKKTKFSSENLIEVDDNVEVPKNSTLTRYSTGDFKNIESIKNAFVTNLSDNELKSFIAPSNFTPSNQPQINSPGYKGLGDTNFAWIWKLVEGEIKSIVLEPPFDDVVWKRMLWYDKSKDNYILKDGFWFKNEFGTYVEYNKNFLWDSTFWERNKSFILGLASMVISIFGPQTWPILLASAAFDLASSYDDLKEGNNVGAAVGVIFAAIPFISKGMFTYSTSEINKVVSKFKNVKTESQFNTVYTKLPENEKRIFKEAFEIDKEKLNAAVKKAKADPNVIKTAIKTTPKLNKGTLDLSMRLKRNLSEVGMVLSVMALSSPIKNTQKFIGKKKEELIKYLFDSTQYGKIMKSYNESIGKGISDVVKNGYSESDKTELKTTSDENLRILSNKQIKDENEEILELFDVEVGAKIINDIVKDPSDTVTQEMMDTLNTSFPKLIKK